MAASYDRFRERIIFPIRDQNGHAVGLGGRILGKEGEGGVDRGPKYLNSPATPLFDKSRTLYLIDRAKSAIRKGGQAVIVEGYTDALMAHQAGFENVVASLGTALTPQQVALVTRYAKRIALAYDVDAAGREGGDVRRHGARGAHPPAGARTTPAWSWTTSGSCSLPEGKDPDEVVRDNPDEWREGVRTARPDRRPPDRRPCARPRPADAGRPGAVRRRGPADHPQPAQPRAPRRLPPARPAR